MTQVRLQLEELSFQFSESAQSSYTDLKAPDSKFVQMLLEDHQAAISEMLSHKYQTPQSTSASSGLRHCQMPDAQALQAGRLYNTSAPPARRRLVRTVSLEYWFPLGICW